MSSSWRARVDSRECMNLQDTISGRTASAPRGAGSANTSNSEGFAGWQRGSKSLDLVYSCQNLSEFLTFKRRRRFIHERKGSGSCHFLRILCALRVEGKYSPKWRHSSEWK